MSTNIKEVSNSLISKLCHNINKNCDVSNEKNQISHKEDNKFLNPPKKQIFNEILMQKLSEQFNIHLNIETNKYTLKQILNFRSKYFIEEFRNFPFTVTNSILYKEGKNYTPYPLMRIHKKTLVILKKVKIKKKKNSTIETQKDNKELIELFDEYHPILSLNFDVITANMTVNPKKFKIKITVLSLKNKVFKLKIPNNNKEIFKHLVIIIHNAIFTSKGYKTNLISVSLYKNFHKNFYITDMTLMDKAKTGDLILFRSFDFAGKVQRYYTGSEYDHVAILIRRDNFLYIYEATSKDGCKDRPWRNFSLFMWNLLYEKIVYRELIINAENEEERGKIQNGINEKMKDFLKKTNGKNYYLCYKALICNGKFKEREQDNIWEKRKGFSCSSLVFGAYINSGIISKIKDVDAVLPRDFCHNEQLELNKPFSLGPEQIIDFTI